MMLQLQNISKTYPVGGQKFQALCQVSFHVEEGGFYFDSGKIRVWKINAASYYGLPG